MKLLVVGCGSIGARHARNARQFGEVGVVDPMVVRASAVSREIGADVFASVESALAWTPDAAIVATPHKTHIELAQTLVAARVPVLIEKPIADRPDGVDALLDMAGRNRVPLFVACNMRFHPGVSTLREHLHEVGNPYFARAHYGNYLPDMRPGADYRQLYCARRENGGGVILDSIHEIDYLTWLFGDAQRVNAQAGTLSDLDIDVEDYAALTIEHAGGVRTEIHLDYLQRFKRRGCEIAGSEGTLIWASEGKNPESCVVKLYTCRAKRWTILYESQQEDGNQPYVRMLRAFLDSVAGPAHRDLLTAAQAASTLAVALDAMACVAGHPHAG